MKVIKLVSPFSSKQMAEIRIRPANKACVLRPSFTYELTTNL